MGSRADADSMGEKIVLQHSVFACFQEERDHFWPFVFFFKKYPSAEFPFEGETASLRAPDVALRGVWTVSYSSGLECILAVFFPISNYYFLLEFSTNAYL